MWHVYLVRCEDRSLYTGIATDVARRFEEHQQGAGRGSRYLRGRGPLELAFQQPVGTRSLALKVEQRIKKLSKAGKEDLVSGRNGIETLLGLIPSSRRKPRRIP
ncbi:MAG: GIY-YIG nuclease family protein [Planctomycetota bacterium]